MTQYSFVYALLIRSASMAEVFFCIFIYTVPFRRRPRFAARLSCCIAGSVLLLLGISRIYSQSQAYAASCVISFSMYIGALLIQYCLFEERTIEYLLAVCAGIATQTIVGRLFELLYLLQGKDPYNSLSLLDGLMELPYWLDWVIYYVLHMLLILLISSFFRRTTTTAHTDSSRYIVIFSLVITVVTILLGTYSRPIEAEHAQLAAVIRTYSLLYGFLVLMLQKGILEQDTVKEELRITQELLYAEKRQFESIRGDMETINIMCHDLRHQLRQYAGRLTEKELSELQSAIDVYDSSIRTGNEILDLILYKKQPVFTREQIQFSCIADGQCLSFMTSSHVFSLFNNAIENAIDAVLEIADPERRVISLTVSAARGVVEIHMTNFYEGERRMEDGMPQTTHPDSGHHGYGVRSMAYIAEQYGGRIRYAAEDGIFYLDVFLHEGE